MVSENNFEADDEGAVDTCGAEGVVDRTAAMCCVFPHPARASTPIVVTNVGFIDLLLVPREPLGNQRASPGIIAPQQPARGASSDSPTPEVLVLSAGDRI